MGLLPNKSCPQCGGDFQVVCFPCSDQFKNRRKAEEMTAEEKEAELKLLHGDVPPMKEKNFSGAYYPLQRRVHRIKELKAGRNISERYGKVNG
jgi:hypothetical protein